MVLNHVNKCISLDMESCTWSRPLVDHINSESWTSPRRVVQKFHVHFIGMAYDSMSKEIQCIIVMNVSEGAEICSPSAYFVTSQSQGCLQKFFMRV